MILQLFSGVTKHLPDGSRIRGDLHMLLIGDPGTGKCIAGGEHIRLSDGSRVEIGPFVEERMDDPIEIDDGYYQEVDIQAPTLGEDGKLTHGRVTKLWKREPPEHMYRIRTATGRELTATPSHPLFVPDNGRLGMATMDELSEDDHIAVPRTVPE